MNEPSVRVSVSMSVGQQLQHAAMAQSISVANITSWARVYITLCVAMSSSETYVRSRGKTFLEGLGKIVFPIKWTSQVCYNDAIIIINCK